MSCLNAHTIRKQSIRPWGTALLLVLPMLGNGQSGDQDDFSNLLFELAPSTDSTAAAGEIMDAGAEPSTQASQSAPETPAGDIRKYQQAVTAMEQEQGPYFAGLREELETLGRLHEETGNHEEAVAVYEQAMHVVRVNNGLFTLEQIPLVRDIIRNYQALGNDEELHDRQEYLYYLNQKNYDPGDPEMLQATTEWADWNVMAYYRSINAGEAPLTLTGNNTAGAAGTTYVPVVGSNGIVRYVPRDRMFDPYDGIGTGNYFSPTGVPMGMTSQNLMDPRLRTARDLYEEIIDTLEENAEDSPAALPLIQESKKKRANVYYIMKRQLDIATSQLTPGNLFHSRVSQQRVNDPLVTRGYLDGRDALEDVLEKLRQDPEASPREVALAAIDLGDWHLSFDRPGRANGAYREAYDTLTAAGYNEAEINAVFAPKPLVEIPTYAIHNYSRAMLDIPAGEKVNYQGYIDVELDVDRYGRVRGVDVVAASGETPRKVRGSLVEHLRMAKARPGISEGETVTREDLVLRYYYAY